MRYIGNEPHFLVFFVQFDQKLVCNAEFQRKILRVTRYTGNETKTALCVTFHPYKRLIGGLSNSDAKVNIAQSTFFLDCLCRSFVAQMVRSFALARFRSFRARQNLLAVFCFALGLSCRNAIHLAAITASVKSPVTAFGRSTRFTPTRYLLVSPESLKSAVFAAPKPCLVLAPYAWIERFADS